MEDPCADGGRHVLAVLAGGRPTVQLSSGGCGGALEQTCAQTGYPAAIRVDQGQSSSAGLDLWAYANNVTLDFSGPGKRTDNAFIEAFNGRLRAECLNMHWFLTLADAQEKLEAWRRYYHEERPHGAIGQRPPISLQNHGGSPSSLP